MQSLVFETMVEDTVPSLRNAIAVSEINIVQNNRQAFQSDQLTTDTSSPNKMFYDSVRILGLRITCLLDTLLIKLHSDP